MPGPVLDPTPDLLGSLVGAAVHLVDADDRAALALDVISVGPVAEADGYRTWTATFRGPGEQPLEQATYLVRAVAGDLWLFLVPSARDDAGFTYVATFNQSLEPPNDGSTS